MTRLRVLAVVIGLVLVAGCSPKFDLPTSEISTAIPTVTRTPAPTYPAPDLADLIPFVKMIETHRFPGLWDGHFDVINAAGGPVVIVVNLAPSGAWEADASYEVYPIIFKAMCQYMIENFPGRQLRVLLTSTYLAYGPDGEARYYQTDWAISVPPYMMQKVVDGAPKAVNGGTPKSYDSEADYFWMLASTKFIVSNIAGIIDRPDLVAWEDDVIPTRTPVPTPRPTKTPTPGPQQTSS